MKRSLILSAVMAIMMSLFGVCAHAATEPSDFSNPVDGDVDGRDLNDFSSIYSPGYAPGSPADINGDDNVNAADVAAFAGAFGTTYTTSAAKPNILLLIADDIGIDVTTDLYEDLIPDLLMNPLYNPGADGNSASMPVIRDRIANQGMIFYNTWAQPVCSPTRGAIITGLFAKKTGVTTPGSPLSSYHTTFVERLRDDGYSTAIFGKWHLGTSASNGELPLETGFELFKGHTGGAIEDFWDYNYYVQDDPENPTAITRVRPVPVAKSLPGITATKYAPVIKAADAIEWITDQETNHPDKPWFVWLAFNEAHWPMHVPDSDTLDGPSFAEVTGCGGVPGSNTRGACSDKVLVRAMTNAMDTVVGKILDAVEALDSNTIVIFLGDNGTESDSIDNMYLTTNGRGKGTVYESGARVAMAFRGPNITPGSQSFEFVHVVDLYNTCLNIAGLSSVTENKDRNNQTVASDSVSLTPILFGSASTVRDPNEGYILTETSWLGRKVGARNATYKLIYPNWTFYDLIDDPLEEDTPLSTSGADCSNFRTDYNFTDWEWHYCRLREVIETESIYP